MNDLLVVTQLIRGRVREDETVASEQRFGKIRRQLEFLETESVGGLPAFAGPAAADGRQAGDRAGGSSRPAGDTSPPRGRCWRPSHVASGGGSDVYTRAHFWRAEGG